jgi:hypothetical protein
MTDLNALLGAITKCDEELKSAHSLLADAQALVVTSEAALLKAQEAFDRAVCDARGLPYATPVRATSMRSAAVEAEVSQPGFAPPLPPPVPVGPRAVAGLPPHLAEPDDRPEGIGE